MIVTSTVVAASGNLFRVREHDARKIVVEFTRSPYRAENITAGDQQFVRFFSETSGSSSEEGKPDLPLEGMLLGIPPNTRLQVEVLESRYENLPAQRIAPVARREYEGEGKERLMYDIDAAFYSTHNQWYPAQQVTVGEVVLLRQQLVSKLSIAPMQWNPVSGQLRTLNHLVIRINLQIDDSKDAATDWVGTSEGDPYFEPAYRSLLLNYDDAKQWRGMDRAIQPPTAPDTSGAWFSPARTYYRIPISQDGIYRIMAADLIAAGINPASIDYPSLTMWNIGKSVPLLLANQSTPESVRIDFYGQRKYGANSFFDPISDTNSYFLAWNDTSARRFLTEPPIGNPPQSQPTWYREKKHFEQDVNYYFGYTNNEIRTTDDVQGEGWYWVDFFPGNVSNFNFSIDTLVRTGGNNASFKVKMNGMSGFFSNPDHLAEFRINGTIVGQVGFNGNLEGAFFQSIPDSLLNIGTNTLEVRSLNTGASINKMYLDWFELEYPRQFRATNNQLLFNYPASPGGPIEFTLRGFTADSIDVFDLTGARKLSVANLGGSVFQVLDTVGIGKKYLAIGKTTRNPVPPLAQKTFRDLRSGINGADYIVITHTLFRPSADQLAQHRRDVSRLRTTVVDVQDIYDEFNFGNKSATSLRDFLRTSYYAWRKPSPTYAVIMGDASWDYKRIFSNSIKRDYVPSYGNPPSDNALVSFHPVKNYLPYMFIGRLPVEDPIQAQRIVAKTINYDSAPNGEWRKYFLFATGGTTSGERSQFNSYSNNYANNYVVSCPIGGVANKVYKSSDAVIDGEFRDSLQNMIRRGLLFYNFIGHSGGRIWNVDPGSPNDFENTDGKLFFVSSVSCWIGFFSDPRSNVLSEDMISADNRAAIGVWAASTTDDAVSGNILTTKFLSLLKQDYARSFGQMTTVSLLNYWAINSVTTPLVIAALHQHPLIGDPYSRFAIPTLPDLAFKDSALSLNTEQPTSENTATLRVNFWNYGICPGDSVLLTINDSYTTEAGEFRGTSSIIPPITLPSTKTSDSISISWDVIGHPGSHVLTARLDSANRFSEVTKSNNSIQQTFYVYRNIITALKPPSFATLASGPATLTASVPAGNDTTPLQYYFQVDTVADFASPALTTSPPIQPGPVAASWTTPSLTDMRNYFWRVRTFDGSRYGAWATSSFETNDTAVAIGKIRWDQNRKKQFERAILVKTTATDTGVTMARAGGLPLYVRSVGARANPDSDFYSIIRIGSQTISGLWWIVGASFIVARVDEYSGVLEYRSFDVQANAALADSMANYIRNTTNGRYVAMTVLFDGRTNVNENLYQAIESLGSVNVRSLQNGHAWALISRKGSGGPLMTPIESWSPASIAECQFQLPNYYNAGIGRIITAPIGPAQSWQQLRWTSDTSGSGTQIVLKVLGIRATGQLDTVLQLSAAQNYVDLSSINATMYPQFVLVGEMSNADPQFTPVLRSWLVDYAPPAELATSAWAFSAAPPSVQQGVPIDVVLDAYNLGYRRSDSVTVSFRLASNAQQLHQVLLDSIPIGSFRHVVTQVPTSGVPAGAQTLQTILVPNAGENDLYAGNNTVLFPFTVTGQKRIEPIARVYFDGNEIMDGDYVSSSPTIVVELAGDSPSILEDFLTSKLTIDGRNLDTLVTRAVRSSPIGGSNSVQLHFRPQLADGTHELQIRRGSSFSNSSSINDSVLSTIHFNVLAATEIRSVLNYPNPFSSETYITFVVTGSEAPEEVRIKLYTVAGRVIREIVLPAGAVQVGFNRVLWNGRDEEGDEIANGYYFYKISMQSGSKSVSTIQRLSKLR